MPKVGALLRIVSLTLALGVVGTTSTPARAAFTAAERARLAKGELVVEPLDLDRGDARYIGGLAYQIIDEDWERLSTISRDVTRFHELLPYVSSATLLDIDAEGVARVRVVHEVGPFHGAYTTKIAFSENGKKARFWLDREAQNDVENAWGFVRFTPLPGGKRTLVTYALLFDLGEGLLAMFESRIRDAALSYPRKLADAAVAP